MRRGQITIFIIIGIILLLVIALGVIAWKYIAANRPGQQTPINPTSDEVEPLRTFVRQCLDNSARAVFERIGTHGGYYEPTEYGYVGIPARPTRSDALEPFPGQTLPYWYHLKTPITCTECRFESEKPSLHGARLPSIEEQAAQAIEERLPLCLGDFGSLQQRFEIDAQQIEGVSVLITPSTVVTSLQYPMKVTTGNGAVVDLTNFTTVSDIPIGRAYDYAEQIVQAARATNFFEGLTVETIVLEGAAKPDVVPPMFGSLDLTFSPGPFWTLEAARNALQRPLASNIGMVQVVGARDMEAFTTGDQAMDLQYRNYYFAMYDSVVEADVDFTYLPSWPMELSIKPGGQLIKPETIAGLLPILPSLKRLSFQYSAVYPLLVQLRLPTDTGEYLFQFPIEVVIRNNEPYGGVPEAEVVDLAYCDERFRNGTIIHLSVLDDNDQPVDALVRYECAGVMCELQPANGGVLSEALPRCVGGTLVVSAEGHRAASTPLDSTSGDLDVALVTPALRETRIAAALQFAVKEGEVDDEIVWSHGQAGYPVDIPYQALITFEPVDDPASVVVATVPGEPVLLAPGDYAVSAVVFETITAPKVLLGEEVCGGIWPFRECATIPDMTLGGSVVDPDTGLPVEGAPSSLYVGSFEGERTITAAMLADGELTLPIPAVNLNTMVSVKDMSVFEYVETFGQDVILS